MVGKEERKEDAKTKEEKRRNSCCMERIGQKEKRVAEYRAIGPTIQQHPDWKHWTENNRTHSAVVLSLHHPQISIIFSNP